MTASARATAPELNRWCAYSWYCAHWPGPEWAFYALEETLDVHRRAAGFPPYRTLKQDVDGKPSAYQATARC